jgi:uncharacterized membrane protein YfcA
VKWACGAGLRLNLRLSWLTHAHEDVCLVAFYLCSCLLLLYLRLFCCAMLSVLFNQSNQLRFVLPKLCFVLGVIGTLLDLGGGELFGPLLLWLGAIPQVSAATTSVISLFTASALVLADVAAQGSAGDRGEGALHWNTALTVFFLALAGGYVGRKIGVFCAVRAGRASVLIFALALTSFLGAVGYVALFSTSTFISSSEHFC